MWRIYSNPDPHGVLIWRCNLSSWHRTKAKIWRQLLLFNKLFLSKSSKQQKATIFHDYFLYVSGDWLIYWLVVFGAPVRSCATIRCIAYGVILPSTIWKSRSRQRATMIAPLFSRSRRQKSVRPTHLFSVYGLRSMTFVVNVLATSYTLYALHTLYLRLSTRSEHDQGSLCSINLPRSIDLDDLSS
jgi:hypothetical protein